MQLSAITLLVAAAIALGCPRVAAAADRMALVIGNGAYQNGSRLVNPAKDAVLMTDSLRAVGFEVTQKTDIGLQEMRMVVSQFQEAAMRSGAKVVAVYYAGHGMEVKGQNYLVPTDAMVTDELQIPTLTLPLIEVLNALDETKAPLKLLMLDCCRDNPLGRSFRRTGRNGLAAVSAPPEGTMIAYATSPGKTILDGEGANSLFATALATSLAAPGLSIEAVFHQTVEQVKRATKLEQQPWLSLNFEGESVFLPGVAQRVALVIGNSAYPMAALTHPKNDASKVAEHLTNAGWMVTRVMDQSTREMRQSIRLFCEKGAGAEAALVYFAGHGIAYGGDQAGRPAKNYLLPVDAKLDSVGDLEAECIALEAGLLDKMRDSGMGLKTVLLDCCRDNPWTETRSWLSRRGGSGLAETKPEALPEGTMLVYAGAPGKTVPDGEGVHSPFAAALIRELPLGGSAAAMIGRISDARAGSEPWVCLDNSDRSPAAFQTFQIWPEQSGGASVPVPVTPATASREQPWINSLGMTFVPAGTPGVLFCQWETRVQDFEAYVDETGVQIGRPMFCLGRDLDTDGSYWKDRGHSWRDPGFPQTGAHPVVGISWEEAKAFCLWLSKKESRTYRLPHDAEWSLAVNNTPYPWGGAFPPGPKDGNYAGKEAGDDSWPPAFRTMADRNDGFGRTAPVGSFPSNGWGLFDLGGNVWEWCEDWYVKTMNSPEARKALPSLENDGGGQKSRVLRGGSWVNFGSVSCTASCRNLDHPGDRSTGNGFRVVLEVGESGG